MYVLVVGKNGVLFGAVAFEICIYVKIFFHEHPHYGMNCVPYNSYVQFFIPSVSEHDLTWK